MNRKVPVKWGNMTRAVATDRVESIAPNYDNLAIEGKETAMRHVYKKLRFGDYSGKVPESMNEAIEAVTERMELPLRNTGRYAGQLFPTGFTKWLINAYVKVTDNKEMDAMLKDLVDYYKGRDLTLKGYGESYDGDQALMAGFYNTHRLKKVTEITPSSINEAKAVLKEALKKIPKDVIKKLHFELFPPEGIEIELREKDKPPWTKREYQLGLFRE